MAINYWIKKNYEMDYAQDNWMVLTLQEFEAFLKTEEGKRRKKGIALMPDGEPNELDYYECGEELAKEWNSTNRRHKYLKEIAEEEKVEVIYIESMLNDDGEEYGEGMIADPDEDVIRDVLRKMEIEQLYKGIALLTSKEKQVINCLFLQEEPMSEREMSTATGIPQKTINNRKKVALIKLKNFFEEF